MVLRDSLVLQVSFLGYDLSRIRDSGPILLSVDRDESFDLLANFEASPFLFRCLTTAEFARDPVCGMTSTDCPK